PVAHRALGALDDVRQRRDGAVIFFDDLPEARGEPGAGCARIHTHDKHHPTLECLGATITRRVRNSQGPHEHSYEHVYRPYVYVYSARRATECCMETGWTSYLYAAREDHG